MKDEENFLIETAKTLIVDYEKCRKSEEERERGSFFAVKREGRRRSCFSMNQIYSEERENGFFFFECVFEAGG